MLSELLRLALVPLPREENSPLLREARVKNKHIKPGKFKFVFGTDEDLDKERDDNMAAHGQIIPLASPSIFWLFFMFCFFCDSALLLLLLLVTSLTWDRLHSSTCAGIATPWITTGTIDCAGLNVSVWVATCSSDEFTLQHLWSCIYTPYTP